MHNVQSARFWVFCVVLCFDMHSVQNAGWGEAPRGWSGVEEEGWRVVSRVLLMLMLLVLVLGSAGRCCSCYMLVTCKVLQSAVSADC